MVTKVERTDPPTGGFAPSWRYWGTELFTRVRLTPRRIGLIYLLFGFSALYFSDVLLVRYFDDPLLGQLQAVKGGVEVLLTAGLVFGLARGREAQMQRGMEHLDQQRTELQVLHRVLRHNLRNDLNVIQGYAEMIRADARSDTVTTRSEKILDAVAKLTRYTNQAGRINKITESNGYRQTFDLTAVIPRLVDSHPDVAPEVRVTTNLPPRASVEANRMFEAALGELLSNAIVHNDKDQPTISIDVSAEAGPAHMVEIRVSDNGPGIPDMEREPLMADEEESIYHLSGLGLWFVKWTVRHSRGEMAFRDNEPEGTTVVLHVPKTSEMFLSGP